MIKVLRALALGGLLSAGLVQGVAAQSSGRFEATFVNIYSQCAIHPPTLVFCGDGRSRATARRARQPF
jgi:hypothetical protein